jgi:hypothetical protein
VAQALSRLYSKLCRNGAPSSGGTPSFVSHNQWILKADEIPVRDSREVPPRIRINTRQDAGGVLFDTIDHAFNDAVLHKNLIAK